MIGWIKGSLLPIPPDAEATTKLSYDFVSGVIGGTLATLANTPFDVVRQIGRRYAKCTVLGYVEVMG